VLVVLAALAPGFARTQGAYIIADKPLTEQYILAAVMQERMAAHGLSSKRRDGLGSAVIFKALAANEIDAYVDYSGTIWANEMHRKAEVLDAVSQWVEKTDGIRSLGSLGFENAYVLAVPRALAEKLGIHTIADLAWHAPELSIAADYEFFERPEWKALVTTYCLHFRAQRTMQSDFMYKAAHNGDVDVISAYSSDGRIAKYDLTVLANPKHALPPYDAILLIAPEDAKDARLAQALKPLIGAIDVKKMQEANLRATGSGASPADVAKWLWQQIQKK
jgi:osmoprotectant transport system permease protein